MSKAISALPAASALTGTEMVPVVQAGTTVKTSVQSFLNGLEKTANKGAAGGYAPLDGTGKVPTANLPAAVVGALKYVGGWNAATNSPAITSGAGTLGNYYVVTTAGTSTVDANSVWGVGDWLVFDGTRWDKLDGQANPVASVDGQQGVVTLATDAAPTTGSKRTLGTGAQQAAAGNDSRFALAQSALQPYLTAQTIFVDNVNGSDSGANIGLRGRADKPFASIAAAAAVAQSGDTIFLLASATSYPLATTNFSGKNIWFVGASKSQVTVVPTDGMQFNFSGATGGGVSNITFGATGSVATGNHSTNGTGFIFLYGGSNFRVADCVFNGINAFCIQAFAIQNCTFERLTFNNVFQPVYIDSLTTTQAAAPANVPSNIRFTDCAAYGSLWYGFEVHSKDGDQMYAGGSAPYSIVAGTSTTGTQAPGLSVGLYFTRCQSTLAATSPYLAFEVSHGWQQVHFTDCYANAVAGYGISCAYCYYVTLTGCTMIGAFNALEYADSVQMHAVNCHIIGSGFGGWNAGPNGQARACSWHGGSIVKTNFVLYGAGQPAETTVGASNFLLSGADLQGSRVTVNHFSDATIEDCIFQPAEDGSTVDNWITVLNQPSGNLDFTGTGGAFVPFAMKNLTLKRNKFVGLVTGTSAVGGISTSASGTNSIDGLVIADNFSDGVYNAIGQYLNLQGTPVTNRYIYGNKTKGFSATAPANVGFINDPPGIAYDEGSQIPANNELTGSAQFAVYSYAYWNAYFSLATSFVSATGASATYTVQAGDTLEYDIWNDVGNGDTRWYVEGACTDGNPLRTNSGNGLADQNGINYNTSTAQYSTGRWYHRSISLSGAAGKTINQLQLGTGVGGYGGTNPNSTSGTSTKSTVYLRRLLVTNGGALQAYVPITSLTSVYNPPVATGFTYTFTPSYQTLTPAQRTSLAVNGLNVTAITSPTPAAVTYGTAGTSSYGYQVVQITPNGVSCGGGATYTLTTGNATLSSVNYNLVSWAAGVPGSTYNLYRTSSTGAPSTTGLIASGLTVPFFADTGSVAGDGTTAPTSNGTGGLSLANLAITGNETVGGTLGVTGKVSFGGTAQYAAATLQGSVTGGNASGMALYNSGGGAGASISLDFYTSANNSGIPQTSIRGLDDGNFSNHLVFLNKIPGAPGSNALAQHMEIFSTGGVTIGGSSVANPGAGNLALTGLIASGPIKPGSYTISTLPSASSTGAGYTATVSNPTAGKSNLVYCNATNWLYADGSVAA